MRGLEQIPWLYDGAIRLMPRIERWRRELAQQARGRTLEVGCGTGLSFGDYADDLELVAIEPCIGSLSRARHRAGDRAGSTELVQADAMYLPFIARSFDTVVSSLVFCSVADAELGLREIRRVLKPEGQLLMLEHVQAKNRFGRWLLNSIQPVWTMASGGCHPNRDTEATLRRCGFVIRPDNYRQRGLFRLLQARLPRPG